GAPSAGSTILPQFRVGQARSRAAQPMVSPASLQAKLRSVGKTILLTTYRGDGSPVSTPVSLAIDDGHRYFRTWDTSWKARRLRRNPTVEIADSTFGGKAAGPAVRAQVRQLSGEDERRARQALARQHPILQS